MLLRSIAPLGLLLLGSIGVVTTDVPRAIACIAFDWDGDTETFGDDGYDGSDGRNGEDGRSGPNREIVADGTETVLDLSGSDGEDGEDGEDGDRARSCRQPRKTEYNVRGAPGGDGGDGGRGGDGGNGGNLTIYYSDRADLSKIYVVAEGGRGGFGGDGGDGARGCDCRERDWDVEICETVEGSSERRCFDREFRCRDGDDGDDGRRGTKGRSGDLGQLTLIPGGEPLPEDRPSATISLSQFGDRPVSLSRHRWETQFGATSLLAPGSKIADEYREYIDTIAGNFSLRWNDPRAIARYGDIPVALNLVEAGKVEATVPESVWIAAAVSQENQTTIWTVDRILREQEATQLKVSEFTGSRQDLRLSAIDIAAKSDILTTDFAIVYRSTKFGDRLGTRSNYEVRYQGEIPPELVELDYNRFTLNLGKLPIDDRYLMSGVGVDIEIEVTRSLGDRSAKQTLIWQGTIR
jgi:hypothetical protein